MTEGIEIIIGKDGVCRARKEPWGVIECETEQDFHFLECAVEFYKKHRWIPVTERVPDIAGMPVLVVAENTYGHKRVVQAFTNYECPVEFETNHKEFDMVWKTAWKVTHWMPLPEIPYDTPTNELVNEESTNCAVGETGGSETDTDKRCKAKTLGDAVDLINRQKAEIERLNHIRAELSKENDRLKAEMSYMKSPNTIGDTHEMGAW